ncbi:MAG TPA: sigma-70 family RNA polymerase sigma factor [Thermoanaerobaculaceae bacterium]|nr:sigma-70 family RNA polymerase sigma factor [Thermoanaerobaculaceae bacterium]HPS79074.1 sigma-70 family RNA polymerase sigma factor [Thermoanaerobaculaceae bacterium]
MTGIDAADLPLVTRDDVSRLQVALAAVGRGEAEALGELFDACGADLYGLALCRTGHIQDAEDVLQEVFVRLARSRAGLGKVRNPRSYLLGMAHRASIDVLRRRRQVVGLDEGLLEATGVDQDRVVDAGRLAALLGELPDAQREAVWLRHFAGLSFAEIGDVTEVPTFTAASRYRLGIARLRRRLGVEP